MRLLFVDFTLPQLLRDAEYPAGGWAVQLRQLLIGLSDAGHCAGVLTWKGANAYVGPQSVCDLLETYDPERGIRKLRLFYDFLPALLAAARRYRPDVIVQSCSAIETGIMALIARRLCVPFVHRIACDTDTDGRFGLYLDRRSQIAFRYGLRNSRFVICQNTYQLRQIERQFPDKPAQVLHNAISIAPSSPAPLPRTRRSYVAWAGTFKRQKNLPLLERIARELPGVAFRVAGMPLPRMDAETMSAVDNLKRLGNVTFAGYLRRSAMPDFLNGAIALLCTSDYEGFSNVFLESLATGTPIVARSIVDPDSIIADYGLGRVAQGDRHLALCLQEVCALDPASYDRLGRRCRGYVEVHHTMPAAVHHLVSMLEPLTRGGV